MGTLGIALLAMVYYFTVGSTQLIAQMQMQVNSKIATLKNKGFAIKESNISKTAKHYVITLDNPQKIAKFLLSQGIALSTEDIRAFQGLEIGMDVHYLGTMSRAVAFDVYPLVLPRLYTLAMHNSHDKRMIKELERMLKNKTFLVHFEVNKLFNHFSGSIKDIDEVIKADKMIHIMMKGMDFEGEIKDKRLSKLSQELKLLALKVNTTFDMNITKLESHYRLTGAGNNNYQSQYILEKVALQSDDMYFHINEVSIDSYVNLENILSGFGINFHSQEIAYRNTKQETLLSGIDFEMNTDNFDMTTLKKLETINPNDEKEVIESLQKIISYGITLSMPNFSIKSLRLNQQNLDGFELSSHFEIDKSLDILSLSHNPMGAISAMNVNLYLSLSSDVFALLAGQPQAMMAMMLVPPNDVNGSKVYDIKLQDSKLTINGQPLL